MTAIPPAAKQSWPPRAAMGGIVDLLSPERVKRWARTHDHTVVLSDPTQAALLGVDSSGWVQASDGSALMYVGTILSSDGAIDRRHEVVAANLLDRFKSEGLRGLQDLEGLASIAIWDQRSQTIHLLRQPGGLPCIFYRIDGSTLEWASRLDSLVRPGDTPDHVSAAQFLRFGRILSPGTMVENIKRVTAGETVSYGPGGLDHTETWTPRWERRVKRPSLAETVEFLETTLADSIGNWLSQTDRPPAILMSGGIDSAGLASAMVRAGADRPVGYTVSFDEDHGQIDEFGEANLVTSHLGIEHVRLTYKPEFISNHLDWMTAWYGEPFGYALHTAQLAEIASAGHNLVFSGTGPDYWYPYESEIQWKGLTDHLPPGSATFAERLIRPLNRLPKLKGLHFALVSVSAPRAEAISLDLGPASTVSLTDKLLSAQGLVDDADRRTYQLLDRVAHPVENADLMSQRAYVWTYKTVPESGMLWIQQWADAYGMRPAMPFLDRRIPAYLATLANLRPDRGEFRELALKSLPRDLAYNRKLGQSLPLAQWFRGPLKGLLRERLTDSTVRPDIMNGEAVESVIRQHLEGRADHKWLLWKLLSLSAWHTRFKELTKREVSA